jgi:hypothetical protein
MKRLVMVSLLLAAIVVASAPGSVSRAQTTTEPLDPLASVPVAYCNVAPRTPLDLAALAQGPANPDGTDIREPIRAVVGAGEPADAVVAIAVDAVMVQLAACLNSGDYGRVYALFSDQALAVILLPEDIALVASGTPEPIPADQGFLPPIVWDVRIQPDGRVTAIVEFDGEYALVTFVWNGERYLIELYDDQIDPNAVPPVASPVGG